MHAEVKEYYGEVLKTTADLKSSACCTADSVPDFAKRVLAKVHAEVLTRYYGCGLILPEALTDAHVLDLGCGAGRDCYVLSSLVGGKGRVVGVDMTAEQLAVAREHQDYHAAQFGYATSNVEFIDGEIENLQATGLADNSFDIIVSNCVINLALDKRAVLEQVFRLLKPGGEMYFADIYTDRRVPEELRTDPVLYGECLSGALYWNDFLNLARAAGFADPRLVTDKPVAVEDPELKQKTGDIGFYSATYRLFKMPQLEPTSEDYGQSVCYRGGIPNHPESFTLDKQNLFHKDRPESVCGNTSLMLAESRLAPYFEFSGAKLAHAGAFGATSAGLPFDETPPKASSGCC
jgi:arsenite methyltransferase